MYRPISINDLNIYFQQIQSLFSRQKLKERKEATEEIMRKIEIFEDVLTKRSLIANLVKIKDVINELKVCKQELKKIGGLR